MSFYSGAAAAALPALAALRASPPASSSARARVSRVSQLDTSLLDNELLNILAAPLHASDEMMLLLRAGLLYLGLKTHGASYGARLQNLVFARPSHRSIVAYTLAATVPVYVHAKVRDAMLVSGWPDYPRPRSIWSLSKQQPARRKRELRRLAWDALMGGEKALAFARLANFLLFLYNGRFPTLLTRLLGMRYTYAQKSVARNVSFEFLNRQLVWEAFTEFLLFLMPLVDLHAVRRWVRRTLYRFSPSALSGSAPDTASKSKGKGPLAHLSEGICAICASSQAAAPLNPDPAAHVTDPVDPTTSTAFLASLNRDASHAGQEATVPYVVDCCKATYCYYCIASAMWDWEKAKQLEIEERGTASSHDGQGWECLRCAKSVLQVWRWTGQDEGYAEKGGAQSPDLSASKEITTAH